MYQLVQQKMQKLHAFYNNYNHYIMIFPPKGTLPRIATKKDFSKLRTINLYPYQFIILTRTKIIILI